MTKVAYDLSRQPYAAEEVEEESRKKVELPVIIIVIIIIIIIIIKVEAGLSREERIAKLRGITEQMLSHKSDYAQSARALAAAAYKVGCKI